MKYKKFEPVVTRVGTLPQAYDNVVDTMADISDEAIAKEVQHGNIEAFEQLVERYEPKIMRYARKFLLERDDAQDLVQEVFFKIYANIRSFDATRKFSSWIYRIAHNEFLNAIEKRGSGRFVSLFDFDIFLPPLFAKETADEEVNRKELKNLLESKLAKLDPKYREPLILYYFEELGYQEIADVLKIPVSTVGIRLRRGREILKKNLKENPFQ